MHSHVFACDEYDREYLLSWLTNMSVYSRHFSIARAKVQAEILRLKKHHERNLDVNDLGEAT
jgi:hypothetical protein